MWTSSLASNMNFPAPLAIAGFLAAGGALVLGALAVTTALFVRKIRAALVVIKLVVVGSAVYFGLLLGFSLVSHQKILNPGQEKYFCEIDCHLAYSVSDIHSEPDGDAVRYTVVVQTRFDQNTITPGRPKDAPLTPNSRQLSVVDDLGREYALTQNGGTPLSTPLTPGQSYTTEFQFRAPGVATNFRLLITSPDWPEHFIIGDEQSPWHKKTWLGL